jgi:hypothetical protein
MTKLNSLARARVIGPEGGAEDGAAGAGVGEGAAGVDVLVVSSSTGNHTLAFNQSGVVAQSSSTSCSSNLSNHVHSMSINHRARTYEAKT